MLRTLLRIATVSVLFLGCASSDTSQEWRTKSDLPLSSVVDRYQDAEVDTMLTLKAFVTRLPDDAEHSAMVKTCGLTLADRLDTVIMVRCPTSAVACVAGYDFVERLELSPIWTPDL